MSSFRQLNVWFQTQMSGFRHNLNVWLQTHYHNLFRPNIQETIHQFASPHEEHSAEKMHFKWRAVKVGQMKCQGGL